MEITVARETTGQQILDDLEAQYGSLKKLQEKSRRRGNRQAQEDWLTASDILAARERREARWTQATTYLLKPREMKLLTPARLELVEWLHKSRRQDINVRDLARRLKRDKKNVSKDLRILCGLHLVEIRREGRQAFPRGAGNKIIIEFSSRA
jgi:predicted transcriptional regulator